MYFNQCSFDGIVDIHWFNKPAIDIYGQSNSTIFKLDPIQVVPKLWWNCIVKLPISNSYNTILTITDTFSKASIFIPCKETTDAKNTALLYATYILPHYRLPSWIISDCDPRFTATFTKELCWILKVDQNISTAYHPQTDGWSEWTNWQLEQYLHIFIDYYQNDWDRWLPLAQYTSMPYQTPPLRRLHLNLSWDRSHASIRQKELWHPPS